MAMGTPWWQCWSASNRRRRPPAIDRRSSSNVPWTRTTAWRPRAIEVISRAAGPASSLLIDAQLRCLHAPETEHPAEDRYHTVVEIDRNGATSLRFEGHSHQSSSFGVAHQSSALEFHLEKGELVVYRQSVAWCDRRELRAILDEPKAGCKVSARRLELVQRVELGSAETD